MKHRRREHQRGFALLLVFALAAAALVMLYLEMPRVAFEHQRDKEALLVERGEEYIRAIQLYVQKFRKYPQKIEDLESTNNVRFLRKRFRDPITGEDEWRLIHVDTAGQYVDSLVHKRVEAKKESAPNVLQAAVQGIGVTAQVVLQEGDAAAVNPALRRTASDRIIPGLAPGQQPEQEAAGEPGAPGQPPNPGEDQPPESRAPAQPGLETPIQGEPGSPAATAPQQTPFRMPGNVPQPQQPGAPGTSPPGTRMPTIGYGGGIGSVSATPPPPPGSFGVAAGMVSDQSAQTGASGPAPGSGQPSPRPGAPNEALQAIQRILTRQPAQGAAQQGAVVLGGGIAGVASRADMEGIRTYNERTNYKEWEFLFDYRKAMQAAGLGTGQPAPGQGSPQQGGPFERPGRGGASPGGFGPGGLGSQGGGASGGFGIGGSQPRPAPAPRP